MKHLWVFMFLWLAVSAAWAQPASPEERALLPVIVAGNYKTTEFFNMVLQPSQMGPELQKRLYECIWPQKVGVVFLPTNTKVKVLETVEFPYTGSESSRGGGLDMGSYSTRLLLVGAHVQVLDGKEAGKTGWFLASGLKRRYRVERTDFPAKIYLPMRIKKDS